MKFEVTPPDQVLWVWRTLEEAGFETWVVGGAIRDVMLGRPAGDWDFATKAHPEQIMAAFRRTVPIGVDHGTVGVLAPDGTLYEVTTFRRDVETFGRRAVVEFAEHIEEDLSRRDFTLNALAWHPGRDELLDPWKGATDMEGKILRTVGDPTERFAEDLLRVLRALRFTGQFGLTIEADTWRALLSAVSELSQLSAERVQEELMKVLAQARIPSAALGLYAESGVFAELFPELDLGLLVAGGKGGGSSNAPPGDVAGRQAALDQTLCACDAVPRTRPLVRLSLLFALASATQGQGDVAGKDKTRGAEGPPWEATRRAIETLMERLRFSNADTTRVATVGASLSPAPMPDEPVGLRRWLNRVGPAHFTDIARAWLAGARAHEESEREQVIRRVNALRTVLREAPPLSVGDLALDGTDLKELGLSPGPQFGEILRYLLEEVLDRPEANNRADLEALAEKGGFLSDASPDRKR
jgi:tRNA nucleotidyltransferase (CCA-adding enzyme)